jgi:hypothetical protein
LVCIPEMIVVYCLECSRICTVFCRQCGVIEPCRETGTSGKELKARVIKPVVVILVSLDKHLVINRICLSVVSALA